MMNTLQDHTGFQCGDAPETFILPRRLEFRISDLMLYHSIMTGVPTTTFSKNFSDIWWGMRMQPWEAA